MKLLIIYCAGFVEEMSITSTQPSGVKNEIKENKVVDEMPEMVWRDELPPEKVFSILERQFYPFKKVNYFSSKHLYFNYCVSWFHCILGFPSRFLISHLMKHLRLQKNKTNWFITFCYGDHSLINPAEVRTHYLFHEDFCNCTNVIYFHISFFQVRGELFAMVRLRVRPLPSYWWISLSVLGL